MTYKVTNPYMEGTSLQTFEEQLHQCVTSDLIIHFA